MLYGGKPRQGRNTDGFAVEPLTGGFNRRMRNAVESKSPARDDTSTALPSSHILIDNEKVVERSRDDPTRYNENKNLYLFHTTKPFNPKGGSGMKSQNAGKAVTCGA
jgi:hypothetical protein